MATINSSAIGGMYLQIDYTVTTNTASNTSTVRATLKLVDHYALYMSTLSGSYLSVGGQKVDYSKTINYSGANTTTTTLYGPRDFTVYHNSDGTASCNLTGTFVMNGTYRGSSVGTMTVSKTIDLPKIARSSSLTVPSSINTGTTLSGTVTPSSSAFNHKVLLKIGSTLMANINLPVGTTAFSYAVDHDWFRYSTSGTIAVVLETYNGTSLVATTSKNVTANVPADVRPSISWFGTTDPMNVLGGLYVQGKSSVMLAATASAGDGAYISTYVYNGPGMYTSTDLYYAHTGVFTASGWLTYTVQVVDTRGRTATETTSFYVYPYRTPIINSVSVQRCDANGNISQSGTYARYTINSTYSDIEGKNTREVTVAYSSNNGSSYSAETTLQSTSDTTGTKTGIYGGGAFALANTYILRFTIKDSYGAIHTITAPLQSAARPININADGKGVAIGGMSTKNAFEVSMNADFNSDINVDGVATFNKYINLYGNIHMGGDYGQTGEQLILFSNDPATASNYHRSYIHGGNPNSPVAIGMYDGSKDRPIFDYYDGNNLISVGDGNSEIYLNGARIGDFVIERRVSEGWTVVLWNSGVMECTGTVSHNPTSVNNGVNSTTVIVPVWFVDASFTVIITPAKCGLLVSACGDCASNNNITHTNNSFVLSYKYDHGQVYTVNFNVHVIGRWK